MEPVAFVLVVLVAIAIPSIIFLYCLNIITNKINKTDQANIRTTIYRDKRYTNINQQIYETFKEHSNTIYAILDILVKYTPQMDETDKRRLNAHVMKMTELDHEYADEMHKLHKIQAKEDKNATINE